MNDAEPNADWRPLCDEAEVEVGMPRRVVVDGLPPLTVFRLEAGADGGEGGEGGEGVFVLADTCSHGQASLAEGYVEGDEIECPWHSGRFCIRDGRATAAPASEAQKTWPARVVDGRVCIAVERS